MMHKPNNPIKDSRFILQQRKIGSAPVTFHHHINEGNVLHYNSIARFLSGTAVGLVLGGGGARGIAHIGVIQALRELGVPIDIVGGTSMGSQVGCLLADELSAQQISQRIFATYSHVWRTHFGKCTDLTFPYLSLTTGSFLSSNFQRYLNGNSRIEDLRIPFFCVSCNLTRVQPQIHTDGLIWEALRASSSVPFVFPPFILPSGDVLVDGGYVNNVPADIMRKMYGANVIIAVDVGDNTHIKMDPSRNNISGWKILFNSAFRGKKYASIHDVLLQLAGITDFGNQLSRSQYVDVDIQPNLEGVDGWLDFDKHDELMSRGFAEAKQKLLNLKKVNPSLSAAIIDKVKYPKDFLSPLQIVGIQKKSHWLEFILTSLANPKVLLIFLSCFGVYQITSNLLYIIRILSLTSVIYSDAKAFIRRVWSASIYRHIRV